MGVPPCAWQAAGARGEGRRVHRLGDLNEAGVDPAPERSSATWADFLRSQAEALLACDFFEAVTLSGARLHVLAVIEHASRRIRVLGATAHPTASRVTQAARNLAMDLENAGCRARYLIRDRDGKFPGLSDAIVADAGIETVLSGVRMPRMNAICERMIGTLRRELFDRLLIISEQHLRRVLTEYLSHYNSARPHRTLGQVPLNHAHARPPQIDLAEHRVRRKQVLGDLTHEYQIIA